MTGEKYAFRMKLNPGMKDEYRKRLLAIVRRKRKGEEVHAAPRDEREAPPDLLEALRASVEAAKGNGRSGTKKRRRSRKKATSKAR